MQFEFLEFFAIAMVFLSLFGLITCNNIIKSLIFSLLFQSGVIMFWLVVGRGYDAPIIYDVAMLEDLSTIADPLPQALMLTAIIIGMSVSVIKITMLNTLFRKHGTTDWKEIQKIEDENFRRNLC